MKRDTVILDCYTDEPSGYGVRPYLGSHQIHLSQALHAKGVSHSYLTIDDLRYSTNKPPSRIGEDTDISLANTTENRDRALEILATASTVYVVMGCFVDYEYFSCVPPRASELANFLSKVKGDCVGFYVMGVLGDIAPEFSTSALKRLFREVEHGNTYRYVLREPDCPQNAENLINPDYEALALIGKEAAPIIDQLSGPVIAEIETGTGCNVPTCRFCIESVRSPRVRYREPKDVINQVKSLYKSGIRHFRLGRQPNFFNYHRGSVEKLERLLGGIREECPDIRTLHIDNVNIIDVIKPFGGDFARIVSKYCTSGNVAAFGIESFDPEVRRSTRVAGSVDDVQRAIEIVNENGSDRGADGLPKLLPGINLIHDLPGSTPGTHEKNLLGLRRILDSGLMTYRLYYRNLTPSTGVTLSNQPQARGADFSTCFDEVSREFVIPMQDRVYPPGTIMKGDWETIRKKGHTLSRMLGTCSIKVQVDSAREEQFTMSGRVRVKGSLGYRLLHGEFL